MVLAVPAPRGCVCDPSPYHRAVFTFPTPVTKPYSPLTFHFHPSPHCLQGCLMFELLAGVPAFEGASMDDIARQVWCELLKGL